MSGEEEEQQASGRAKQILSALFEGPEGSMSMPGMSPLASSQSSGFFGALKTMGTAVLGSGAMGTITRVAAAGSSAAAPLLRYIPSVSGSSDTIIGKVLGAATSANSDTPYLFGGNSVGRCGGIDCSHWAWQDTLNCMQYINDKAGQPIYDMKEMRGLLTPTAAHMVMAIGNRNGFYNRADIDNRNLPPGTLIGVDRGAGGDSHGRSGIIHVAQVALDAQGNLCISESGGSRSGAGVHLMAYDDWMRTHKSARLIAANPFLVDKDKRELMTKRDMMSASAGGESNGSRGSLKVETAAANKPPAEKSIVAEVTGAVKHGLHKAAELTGITPS